MSLKLSKYGPADIGCGVAADALPPTPTTDRTTIAAASASLVTKCVRGVITEPPS
jgi:hypothetical protein